MARTDFIRRALVAVSFALAAYAAVAATQGTVLKKTSLRAKPFLDAPATLVLAPGAQLNILQRKSGWLLVKSGIRTGWVRMLDVRTGTAGSGTSATVIGKGTVQLATGRSGSGNVVATSGIRGLDEESLAKAEPDPAQLEKLKSFAASGSVARSYAKRAGLKARSVAALPLPQGQP